MLKDYSNDERILMWDIYNEPGQFGIGDKAFKLLQYTWEWALKLAFSMTACLDETTVKNPKTQWRKFRCNNFSYL